MVSVLSFAAGQLYEEELRSSGVTVETLSHRAGRLQRLRATRTLVATSDVEVLQAAHTWVNPYVATAVMGTRVLGVGAVRSDGLFEVQQNPVWGRLSLAVPSTVIVNSVVAARRVSAYSWGRRRAISFVPNVIEVDTTVSDRSAHDDPPAHRPHEIVVLAVANMTPVKRLDILIKAFALARGAVGDSLHLWLVGDGPELNRLKVLAGALGVSGSVSFLGRRTDVPALMDRSDVYALTSDHEGFPNSILEAMAAGLPVVATDAGAVPDVIAHAATGYVVPKGDHATFARLLISLARDQPTRSRFGAAGRQRVLDYFRPPTLGTRLEDAYAKGAASRRIRAGRSALRAESD
jgi:glycosyltransferase involved in cell wall biosynthesis